MEKIDRFNLRVYGLWVYKDALLLLKENYAGRTLEKFPGGGVEPGEGLKDTLIREFKEELNLEISEIEHFYTQDFFVPSIFKDNEQIQTFYYFVQVNNPESLQIKVEGIERLVWLPKTDWANYKAQLPVDNVVMQKLLQLNH